MTITVAPPSRTISATQEISYTNNSPFPLPQRMIRLYLNAHLPQAQREDNYTPDFLTDGIIIDQVSVNGTPVEWQNDFPLNTIRRFVA